MNQTGHGSYPLWLSEWATYRGGYENVSTALGTVLDNLVRGSRPGRVALVEQQVKHSQHRGGPLREQMGGRDSERDAGVADLALGADQALGHRVLRHQERPGGSGQPRSGPAGNAVARPALERLRKGVLRAFLGKVPVAGQPDEGRDDLPPLLAERLGDGLVEIRTLDQAEPAG